MRVVLASFVLFLCSFPKIGYTSYCNNRFNFCIEYPSSFSKQQKPDNDDGLIFLSADKKTKIRAFGSLATEPFNELKQELEMATYNKKVTYKTVKNHWFIISGTDKEGNIFYRKTIKGRSTIWAQAKQKFFKH